ncbi:MAG: glucose-6-phosphate isomerase, partial [Pseudomonadota bacterium]
LARDADVPGWRKRLFAGQAVNNTEDRAALHMALRNRSNRPMTAKGKSVTSDVLATLGQMRAFVKAIHSGARAGHGGARIKNVVAIGIGGSDLGPRLACEALAPFAESGVEVRFLANVDGADFARAVRGLDAAGTLFIVASKMFATQETMANARAARDWIAGMLGEAAVPRHFAAVTAARAAAEAFGIPADAVFDFWDWVGGRFSLWSAVGLPVALATGMDRFEEMLSGAHVMDEHFRLAPLEKNIPATLALIGAWNATVLGIRAHAVLPYDSRLARLPVYLQQLEMESNGKSVTRDGRPVPRDTAPVLLGEAGTNAQHTFLQLLHQGTTPVSADFIAAIEPGPGPEAQRAILLANMLAQSEALMRGRTMAEARAEMKAQGLTAAAIRRLAPHRFFPGNRPSTTLLIRTLDPFHLGLLLALYEHKVFVQSVLWEINPFDQWGVELGKKLADGAARLLATGTGEGQDSSTLGLARRIRAWRARKS